MKYKKVRFEYYQVVYRKNSDSKTERDRLFDLVRWINQANKFTLLDRTYDYYTEKARLETAYYDDEMNYYFLHFVRLGDNIPSKGRLNGKVEPLELEDDEYIGNEVTALYDENQHIIMLQRNRSSLGPSGIELYLNTLWSSDEETIFLRPISPKGMFEQASKADHFRKIHMRFADIDPSKIEGSSPVISFINNFSKYSGVNGEIVISIGKKRDRSLESTTMIDTINDIIANKDSGVINKAEVHYKYTDDTAVEVVDLFAKKAHDFHSFPMEKRTTLSHEAIAVEMWNIYHKQNKRTKILGYLAKE